MVDMEQYKRAYYFLILKVVRSFFMASQELQKIIAGYENYINVNGATEEIVNAYCMACETAILSEKDIDYGLTLTKRSKGLIESLVERLTGGTIWDLEKYSQDNNVQYDLVEKYYRLLKLESYNVFESFVLYMEKKRPYVKRFYQPRKKTLIIVVNDLQSFEDSTSQKFQGVSQPSRSGKSTLCILFLLWVAMKRPNSHNAMGGHSGILAKGFYKELLNMMTSEEYTFVELFFFWHPEYSNKPFPTDKSADDFTITIGDSDRFATITCRGIDGTWTGAVDVSKDGYLYVDDLVRDREHSLSPQRMENTFQEYLNKMVDRKNDGAKELMVGTLWNVLDPLERIRVQYENDPNYKFRKIPALNENDESNFDYEINGFSTEYYRAMRDRLANAEWMAKYQQQPYVREGLLFPKDELKFTDGIIYDGTWIVTALCDPAFGGADRLSMPVKLKHKETGKSIIIDWVYKSGTQNVTLPLVAESIIRNCVTELRIEKNAGGGLYADSLKKELESKGCHHCRIILFNASNKMDKMERIKAFSDYVKDNYYFLIENMYLPTRQEDELAGISRFRRNEMYDQAMSELNMITAEGKNAFDDCADSITNMAMIEEKTSGNKVEAIANPFRGGYGYGGY